MRSMLHTPGGRRSDLPLRLPLLLLLLLLCFCLIKSSAAAATSRIRNGGYRATCLAFAPVSPASAKTLFRPTCRSSYPAVCNPTATKILGFVPTLSSSSAFARDGVVRYATKGNKKNRTSRRRKSDHDEDCDSDSDGCQAPRVSSQINIPVRRQIAFVKQMKKLMKAEERPKEVAKKARRKKDPTQREAISGDYARFDQSMCSTYLLVDGYNVINNWSKMIKARSVAGMPSARQALLEQLRYIYHSRRWKVVVAYDEHTPGSELRVMEGDVDEVYTGAQDSADSYIERRAVELCKKSGGPRVKVATDDRTIQVVSLASGAEMMSTSSLIKEIYLARRELLFQRDNSDWRTKKAFDDAQEYFID